MVTDLFGSLLEELGGLLKIKLAPDKNNSCLIKTKEGVSIQLELDRSGRYLLLASKLPEIPPQGRYRESLFQAALKANGMPAPHYGIFAYSKPAGRIVLFAKLDIQEINGAKIFALFTPFMAKALAWHEAIGKGDIPPLTSTGSSKVAGGLFGLHR